MPKIKLLSPIEAQKIAAGEVIDRPVSIVKELVENAIDAQAQKISIFIEDGGKKLIRIVDNGCGMDKQDAQNCFKKHATSKITHINDLDTINTFGFRGEALASVAAISKVTLVTKLKDASEGIKISVIDGIIGDAKPVPANTGTDIAVQDVFYNIPARKKFLKKQETEWRHIMLLFQAFCLNYPSIHFSLFKEGKQILNCPPVKTISATMVQLFGANTAHSMLPIDAQRNDNTVSLVGLISNHQQFRYDRNNIFFFVNKRWVKNSKLTSALLKGYKNVLPHGKYPTACITISVDPTLVDINIHPRKEEVKFMHPRIVEQLITQTVTQQLEQNISTHINHGPRATSTNKFTPFDFNTLHTAQKNSTHTKTTRLPQDFVTPQNSTIAKTQLLTPVKNNSIYQKNTVTPSQPTLFEHTQQKKSDYHLIGHYHKTYILIEQKDGLFLIDQHAAHERILYELFEKNFQKVASTALVFPQIINISQENMHSIEPHLSIFKKNGIMIEPFGKTQLIIQATPSHVKNIALEDVVKQVISWINEYQHIQPDEFFTVINEKLRAQMACKAAIKAGDSLTREQMLQLLDDLHKTNNRFTCPHGRPTGWLLSLHEIEKKFKRRT